MYKRVFHILVLDDDTLTLYQTMALLKQRDYMVVAAARTEHARWWLAQWPIDLLVSAVRLRGSGGLEFLAAARAEHPELAGILIGGASDANIENDAWRYGATLVIRPYNAAQFLMTVAEKLASIRRRQRWPRKRVMSAFPVHVGGTSARLVDVSYGGLRLTLDSPTYNLPSPMTIDIPNARLQVHAQVVWSARGEDGVSCDCGASIIDDAPAAQWRRFVDRVPQAH